MMNTMPRLGLVALAVTVLSSYTARAAEVDPPNILWITIEDISPHLGCYGDDYAVTPSIDTFARDAVRYSHAFASAPVCSPARSCLITGVYASSLGTQRLRSVFPIPDSIRGFPAYLREAGYHTSNNVKTDYNTSDAKRLIEESWDESSKTATWRGRKEEGQPFFSVINLTTTHQSRASVWSFEEFEEKVGSELGPELRHDPAKAPLPPYYPDTELARRTVARYYDCITLVDRQVGEILNDLESDGLSADTIVFIYSDHGMGLPRGKRNLHDSGLQVPLLIRFPEKWKRLAPAAAGDWVERLVSFVDFPPTMLSILGLEIPGYMQGRAFLGDAAAEPREYVYGARDRVDEADDVARSVRDGRWLYIRNYMPHLSSMQFERYSDGSDFRREFLRLAGEGKLDAAQMTYAAPRRAVEELYDTTVDPHQVSNLADIGEYEAVLKRMRAEHRRWLRETRDVGLLPEAEAAAIVAAEGVPLYEWARGQAQCPGDAVLDAAGAVGGPVTDAQFAEGMESKDAAVRYWTVMSGAAQAEPSALVRAGLEKSLADESASVRGRGGGRACARGG